MHARTHEHTKTVEYVKLNHVHSNVCLFRRHSDEENRPRNLRIPTRISNRFRITSDFCLAISHDVWAIWRFYLAGFTKTGKPLQVTIFCEIIDLIFNTMTAYLIGYFLRCQLLVVQLCDTPIIILKSIFFNT